MHGVRSDWLADVLGGGSIKTVWRLKQFIASDGQETLMWSATVDYGFRNCLDNDSDELGGQLAGLYKMFFEMSDADQGCLFRFCTDDKRMKLPGSRKLLEPVPPSKLLIQNPRLSFSIIPDYRSLSSQIIVLYHPRLSFSIIPRYDFAAVRSHKWAIDCYRKFCTEIQSSGYDNP